MRDGRQRTLCRRPTCSVFVVKLVLIWILVDLNVPECTATDGKVILLSSVGPQCRGAADMPITS